MALPSAEMGDEMGGIRQPATASPIIKNKISKWQLSYQSLEIDCPKLAHTLPVCEYLV